MTKVVAMFIFSLVFMFGYSQGFAGDQTGKVSNISIRASDGLHFFEVQGASYNKPSCAGYSYWMIKDEKSAVGKSQIAQIMLAYSTGKSVAIRGSGTCTRWPDGEDVDLIILLPD